MSETEQHLEQLSLLIHLWQEDGGATPIWRASIRHVADGRRVGFASTEKALQYLAAEFHALKSSQEEMVDAKNTGVLKGQDTAKP